MASAVQVLLPSFGYTYTFTGVLSVKHEYSLKLQNHIPTGSSFSAWTLQVVCYGPHAISNARKIRAFLLVDGPGFSRAILRQPGSGRCRIRRNLCCSVNRRAPSGEKERT